MKNVIAVLLLAVAPVLTFGQECSTHSHEVFEEFRKRFSADASFALSRTRLPLQMLKWEYGLDKNDNSASTPKRSIISRAEYMKWPSLASYMEQNDLTIIRQTKKDQNMVVDINKESTDWLFSYYFRMEGGCWYFWQLEDQSL